AQDDGSPSITRRVIAFGIERREDVIEVMRGGEDPLQVGAVSADRWLGNEVDHPSPTHVLRVVALETSEDAVRRVQLARDGKRGRVCPVPKVEQTQDPFA